MPTKISQHITPNPESEYICGDFGVSAQRNAELYDLFEIATDKYLNAIVNEGEPENASVLLGLLAQAADEWDANNNDEFRFAFFAVGSAYAQFEIMVDSQQQNLN